MNFYFIGACEALAAFGVASLSVSALLLAGWWAVRERAASWSAASRAGALLALRLAPTAIAVLVTAGLVVPSYVTLEPRDTAEVPDVALGALAAVGLGLVLLAAARLATALRRTRRVLRVWSRAATPVAIEGVDCRAFRIETPAPIVALAGVRRPRLYLSGSVLDGCGGPLVSAIAAHEMAHRRSGDNLKRLLFEAAADPLGLSRVGRQIREAWEVATEEAADDAAVAAGAIPDDLAEALLRVARLAPGDGFPAAVVAAFYRTEVRAASPRGEVMAASPRGGAFERRVRRLVAPSRSEARRGLSRRSGAAILLLLALGWVLAAHSLLKPVHRLFEHAVHGPHAHQRSLVVVHPPA